MGGPSCTIILKERLSEAQLRDLPRWLESFGEVSRDPIGFWMIIVTDPQVSAPVLPEHPPNICVSIGEPDEKYYKELLDRIPEELGWRPKQFIEGWGTTRQSADHLALGRVVLGLAEQLDGWIHLFEIGSGHPPGAVAPAPPDVESALDKIAEKLHPEDRDLPDAIMKAMDDPSIDHAGWSRCISEWVHEGAMKYAAASPGRVIPLKNEEDNYSYLVDATFMRSWVASGHFYFE